MFKKIIVVALLLGSVNLFAHEGHDHNAPGTLKANHGGVVKAGKNINLEYVVSGEELKLIPAAHEGETLAVNEVKLTATAKLPKTKKQEPLKLDFKDGVYLTKIDFKGAYRAEIMVKADNKGKQSAFKFQVEK
ncbi:MAG: hypothetical protein AABY53_06355 [Bdellovibrionota bacterium]